MEAARRVGCDIEARTLLPEGVADRVLSAAERADVARMSLPDVLWFSAKETVFKAVYPDVGRFFGFDEAEIEFDADGTFTAVLSRVIAAEAGVSRLEGRWLLTSAHAFTLIAA